MFGLFKNKKRSSIAYIFDISSASVGGAVVKLEPNSPPKILYGKRIELEAPTSIDFERLTLETFSALKSVALDLGKEGFSHLTFTGDRELDAHIHCFLASPYAFSETKVLRIEKPKTIFTKSLEEDLVKKEERFFKDNIVTKYESISKEAEILIDKKIVEIKLNGYPTANPYGKTADHIELVLYLGIASKEITVKMDEIITSSLKMHSAVRFHTFPLASYCILNDVSNEDDFSILDITGEITDISIVKCGVVSEATSFPLAKNQLTREIARKFATSYFEANSVLKMYFEKSISKQLEAKVKTILDKYHSDFMETLRQVCPDALSRKTYIIAPSYYENAFSEWLRAETNQPVIVANSSLFSNKINSGFEADAFLAIESLYVLKIL